MPSNPRESLSSEKEFDSPSAETITVSELSNEAFLPGISHPETIQSDNDDVALSSDSISGNNSNCGSPIAISKHSDLPRKKDSLSKPLIKLHKHFSSDILEDIKPEIKRRSPGRPRRKRSIDELPPSGLSGRKSTIPSRQPKRQNRHGSVSPPPARNSSVRRRLMSRQSNTQNGPRSSSKFDSNHSPSATHSLSPSPVPSASGDKSFNLSDLSEEQLKLVQKEAVSLLKRIEAEFTRLKSMIYQEKLAELMLDVSAIQDGTSPLLHNRAREAKERYKMRILSARRQREYSLWEASSQLAAQQYTIDTQFLHDKLTLQQRLHDQVLKDRWEIEETKIIYESRQVNPRIYRISCEPEERTHLPEKEILTFQNVVKGLDEEEALSDLAKMRNSRQFLASSSPDEMRELDNGEVTSSFTPVIPNGSFNWIPGSHVELPAIHNFPPDNLTAPPGMVNEANLNTKSSFLPYPAEKYPSLLDNAVSKTELSNETKHIDVQALGTEILQIDNVNYRTGDRVLLLDHSQAVTFHARLAGVSPEEVSLLKFDGTRTRIPFTLLTQGRYQISFTSDNPCPPIN